MKQKCAIVVPAYTAISAGTEEGLRELERRGYAVRRGMGCSAVDQARNTLATMVLDEGFDELLWVDSDIGFNPDDVEVLRSHNLPFVCGLYALRGGGRGMGANWLPGQGEVVFGQGGGLVEILSCGMGFVLTRREVYDTIRRKFRLPVCNIHRGGQAQVPYFMPQVIPDGRGHWYLPDDLSFCHRVREAGFKLWADTRIRLLHFGEYAYGWEDAGEKSRFTTFKFSLR